MNSWTPKIAAFLFLTSMPAGATYNVRCVEDLHAVALTGNEQLRKQTLVFDLENMFEMNRTPTALEFEALMDVRHSLSLIANFANGTRVLAPGMGFPQTLNLRDQLRRSSIIDVTYLPSAATQLGSIYKRATEILGRHDKKNVYDYYTGLNDERKRPLIPTEELALKWATFHLLPNEEFVNLPLRHHQPKEEVLFLLNKTRERNLEEALRIISGRFDIVHARKLMFKLVRPILVRHFLRLRMLINASNAK